MPDNQQRLKSAGEDSPLKSSENSPSTGRRGSHPAPGPDASATSSERKQKSLREETPPPEHGAGT